PTALLTDWCVASASAAFSFAISVCTSVVKLLMSAFFLAGLFASADIALSSDEILFVIDREAFSAEMHPGSAAVELLTIATKEVDAAPTTTATTMATIDRTLPALARARDLTSPMIAKMMPAIANPLPRFSGP
ncbi:MAG TPA: hypothetical protein VF482_00475, partial [Trebonia sp.]